MRDEAGASPRDAGRISARLRRRRRAPRGVDVPRARSAARGLLSQRSGRSRGSFRRRRAADGGLRRGGRGGDQRRRGEKRHDVLRGRSQLRLERRMEGEADGPALRPPAGAGRSSATLVVRARRRAGDRVGPDGGSRRVREQHRRSNFGRQFALPAGPGTRPDAWHAGEARRLPPAEAPCLPDLLLRSTSKEGAGRALCAEEDGALAAHTRPPRSIFLACSVELSKQKSCSCRGS